MQVIHYEENKQDDLDKSVEVKSDAATVTKKAPNAGMKDYFVSAGTSLPDQHANVPASECLRTLPSSTGS